MNKPKGRGPTQSILQPMRVRPVAKLRDIRQRFGSPFLAAANGKLNAEEFLLLEKLNEH